MILFCQTCPIEGEQLLQVQSASTASESALVHQHMSYHRKACTGIHFLSIKFQMLPLYIEGRCWQFAFLSCKSWLDNEEGLTHEQDLESRPRS